MSSAASERLHRCAATLRAQGDRGMRLQMNATLRAEAQPMVSAVRAAARAQLPKSGGLAEQQASQAIRISVVTGSRSAGVRIRTRTRGSMQTDKGFVRHPVFGKWLPGQPSQQIPQAAGWWSKTLYKQSPAVTAALQVTMRRIAVQVMNGSR